MIRGALALAALALLAAAPARAEKLTIALSANEIDISASFTGVPLTIFGVIEPDAEGLPADPDYQVAVVVLGPRETVVVREKDRILGIWANADGRIIINPPSYYALSVSAPVDYLAPSTTLARLELGFDNIAFIYQGGARVNDPASDAFREAFLRLKQEDSLYSDGDVVTFIGNTVFRTSVPLPANLPTGNYTAVAYLFSRGELIARAEAPVTVSKTGFEATMASFAHTQPLPYGIICVALALFVGWLGGVIFRRD